MSNGAWTDEENDLIVADYFAMLADDITGRRYSKAGMIFGRPFCLRTLSGTKIWMDSSGFIIPPPPSFVGPSCRA